MAATVTLTELKARTLLRADMSSGSPDQFIDQTSGGELETYIQQAGRELYDKILSAYGEDYYYSSSTTTTVAGTATVDLPSDFYRLLGVDASVPGAVRPVALERFNWNERNVFEDGVGWNWSIAIPRYRLRAGKVWMLPTPDGAHSVTIHYVPVMPTIDDSTGVFDGINGWDEWIVVSAAIKCLQREESDTSELERELARCGERIARMAPNRDLDKPPTVVDVFADRIGWDDL